MTKIDLAYGDPRFIREYWRGRDLPEADLYYPSGYMSEKQNELLEEEIRKIHTAVGNVSNIDEYHIAIGNGASQLISAVLYETPDVFVTAPIPYFLRFPVLAQIGDNTWSHKKQFKNIITAPNNPTGDWDGYDCPYRIPAHRTEIIDACYNWPQYTTVRPLNDDIIIFSLSKATGHAGARLGWVLCKDEELAKNLRRSVEVTTMGVSQLTQEVGRFVLRDQRIQMEQGKETCFSYGKQILDLRWETLKNTELPFKILNSSGMFAWCEGEMPDHVTGIEGSRFGDDNTKFRLNIGCSIPDFTKFMKAYDKDDDFV